MDPVVVGQLGVEGGEPDVSIPEEDRAFPHAAEDFDPGGHRLEERRTDEHAWKWLCQALNGQVFLE